MHRLGAREPGGREVLWLVWICVRAVLCAKVGVVEVFVDGHLCRAAKPRAFMCVVVQRLAVHRHNVHHLQPRWPVWVKPIQPRIKGLHGGPARLPRHRCVCSKDAAVSFMIPVWRLDAKERQRRTLEIACRVEAGLCWVLLWPRVRIRRVVARGPVVHAVHAKEAVAEVEVLCRCQQPAEQLRERFVVERAVWSNRWPWRPSPLIRSGGGCGGGGWLRSNAARECGDAKRRRTRQLLQPSDEKRTQGKKTGGGF